MIYLNVCDLKISWDKEIPRENQNQRLKLTRDLHEKTKLLRSIPSKGKQLSYKDNHLLSDANLTVVSTVACVIVNQQNTFNQNLTTKVSKKKFTLCCASN